MWHDQGVALPAALPSSWCIAWWSPGHFGWLLFSPPLRIFTLIRPSRASARLLLQVQDVVSVRRTVFYRERAAKMCGWPAVCLLPLASPWPAGWPDGPDLHTADPLPSPIPRYGCLPFFLAESVVELPWLAAKTLIFSVVVYFGCGGMAICCARVGRTC